MAAGTRVLAPGSLTDVAGLAVGHAAEPGRATGCTVVLCPQGVVCGVAVRGGAPGTRETDLLRPENTVDRVHAVLLTGGSAFGLDAAGGVMRWLEERGHGLEVKLVAGPGTPARSVRVPIVPAAVLFDLGLGDPRIRPGAATGYAACEAASGRAPAQGNAGAGLGATVGKGFGSALAMKGGIGSASLRVGGCTVGALVAVNAVGDVLDEAGAVLAGARTAGGRGLADSAAALLAGADPLRLLAPAAGTATTIGVVATDAQLTKAQATQLASLAHHGLARAVSPLTVNDGDTFFALATGAAGRAGDLGTLGPLAAEVVARAIRNAVRAAEGLADPPLPAARDLLPRRPRKLARPR
jgi:L-aminopeptidase/D-esterase-like protein